MKSNIKLFLAASFLFFWSVNTANAQLRVVNEDGDVIVMLPDGTWNYEDPEKESKRTDKNSPPPKNVVPATAQKEVSKNNTKGEKNKKKNEAKPPKNKTAETSKNSKTAVEKPRSIEKTTTPSKPQPAASNNKKVKATVYEVPKRERKFPQPVVPAVNCEYAMRERDIFTGKVKVAVQPQVFFSYTQRDLKKFMRDKDYLTCSGSLSRVVGMTIFNVKFEVESARAQLEYGEVTAGTQMLIKLLNGKTITLTCQEESKGIVDEVSGKTVYRTYFGVDKGDEKELQRSEVMNVRMIWSTGYEDYQIHELDFFINQFKCLNQAEN